MKSVLILSPGETHLRLSEALLMYKSGSGDVYATSHPVHADPDAPGRSLIGAGVPLTKAALVNFAEAVGAATTFGGFVPERLVYTSPNIIAWWTPEAVRRCWFLSEEEGIGEVTADVAHPALVFVVEPNDFYVFALDQSIRPSPETPLFHSPHFNVWDGGQICTGNVALPPAIDSSAIALYEDAFLRSRFTHPNRQGAVASEGGMIELWKSQIVRPDMDAMRAALKKSQETLQQAIKRISINSKQ